jgi:hypothetical protein
MSAPIGRNTTIRTASWKPTVLNDEEPNESAAEGRVAANLAAKEPMDSTISHVVIPHVIVQGSGRPKADQVSAAFLEACIRSEEMLRGRDLFKSPQSLVVFDHFEVKKVHTTANQGWIEIQIEELFSLAEGKAEIRQESERQRWAMRLDDNGNWRLTPSRNAIYLSRHAAERLVAHEFAQLTEDTSENTSGIQEKAELARLLEVLFVK